MYVALLARLYDASYRVFCSRALHISRTDYDALTLADPSDEVLERLSAGVGIPVEDLRALRPGAIWNRVTAEFKVLTETEAGRREVESMFGQSA